MYLGIKKLKKVCIRSKQSHVNKGIIYLILHTMTNISFSFNQILF